MAHAEIAVRLRARGGRDAIEGFRDGRLNARVTAPPLEGRANRALRRLIARRVGVAPSRVTIERGERSRDKLLRVEGVSPAELRRALGYGGGPDQVQG